MLRNVKVALGNTRLNAQKCSEILRNAKVFGHFGHPKKEISIVQVINEKDILCERVFCLYSCFIINGIKNIGEVEKLGYKENMRY
jgi:hypothetical protein